MPVFLESKGAIIGPATLKISIVYAGKETTQEIPILVGTNSLTKVIPSTFAIPYLIIISVVVGAIIIGAIFIYRTKRAKVKGKR